MAYSDFNLKKAKSELNLELIEDKSLFVNVNPIEISPYLAQTLKRNVPLALQLTAKKPVLN